MAFTSLSLTPYTVQPMVSHYPNELQVTGHQDVLQHGNKGRDEEDGIKEELCTCFMRKEMHSSCLFDLKVCFGLFCYLASLILTSVILDNRDHKAGHQLAPLTLG